MTLRDWEIPKMFNKAEHLNMFAKDSNSNDALRILIWICENQQKRIEKLEKQINNGL